MIEGKNKAEKVSRLYLSSLSLIELIKASAP
jgi:hypothetical protein